MDPLKTVVSGTTSNLPPAACTPISGGWAFKPVARFALLAATNNMADQAGKVKTP
jgi:hypothetical protein